MRDRIEPLRRTDRIWSQAGCREWELRMSSAPGMGHWLNSADAVLWRKAGFSGR